jgi:hypothetical protein
MSTEDLIRTKHQFENELNDLQTLVRWWLKQFHLLSTQELEIGTARALDQVAQESHDLSAQFRLKILASALKNRSLTYKPSDFKRFWCLTDADQLLSRFFTAELLIPKQVDTATLDRVIQLCLS